MTRALIVGPRENLEATVESLYGLRLVHIVDHREGEEGLEIGRPLPTASEASEILVKLRSIASVLQLEDTIRSRFSSGRSRAKSKASTP